MDKSKKYKIVKKENPSAPGEPAAKPDDGYVVGYGKPPKHTQFKPGQSGNPKGKPRGTKHLRTIIQEEANAIIKIKEGNKLKKITKKEALIKSLMAKGIKGETKSIEKAIRLIGEIEAKVLEDKGIQEAYSEDDLAVLSSFLKMQDLLKAALDE